MNKSIKRKKRMRFKTPRETRDNIGVSGSTLDPCPEEKKRGSPKSSRRTTTAEIPQLGVLGKPQK